MSSDSTPPSEDKNLQSDNTDSESVDSNAYWEDYYKQRTPQIDPEELEKIRKDEKKIKKVLSAQIMLVLKKKVNSMKKMKNGTKDKNALENFM